VLALVCLPVFIGALDLTIVSAVLPNVIVDLEIPFQTGADDAAWVVSGYLLAYTVSVVLMGRVSDLIGRRRTYFIALLIFVLGSWLVAVATFAPAAWMSRLFRLIEGGRPDPAYMALYVLVAGRVVQALGAGAMVPVSMALVGDLFPPAERAVPLGLVATVDTAGWVLGALYGGAMVQIVEWPVMFWINIPVTTVVAVVTWRQLAPVAKRHDEGGLSRLGWGVIVAGLTAVNALAGLEIGSAISPTALQTLSNRLLNLHWLSLALVLALLAAVIFAVMGPRRQRSGPRLDAAGAVLITLALIGLNVGLGGGQEGSTGQTLQNTSPLPPYAAPVLIGAAVCLIGFVLVERHSQNPLFALRYFRDRNVSLACAVNLLVGFCLMVGMVSVPLFVNTVIVTEVEQAALVSGLLLGALTIPMALASVPGGVLTRRFGYRLPTGLGLLIAAGGFYIGQTSTPDITRATMALNLVLAGVGLGLTVAPVGTSVINAVRSDERGAASALVLIMRLIGMTIGTSVMTNYGLHRSTRLTESMVAALGNEATFAQLAEIGRRVATTVINEMMVIAAAVCLAAVILAVLLRARDRTSEGNTL
jgi:MFS family permease